jgi:hypothetical protein
MAATIDALGIDAGHVVFGHTHRSGPHPGDEDWDLPGGSRGRARTGRGTASGSRRRGRPSCGG